MVKRFFSKEEEKEIVLAIQSAELTTSAEIRVHVNQNTKEEALIEAQKIFKKLKMDRTRDKNAILILVDPRNNRMAIIGDSGIHEKVTNIFWEKVRDEMIEHFKKEEYLKGVLLGIREAGQKLKFYFPKKENDINELSNKVTEN